MELMEFAQGMDMGLEGPRGVKDDAEDKQSSREDGASSRRWEPLWQGERAFFWDTPGLTALPFPFHAADPRTAPG